MLRLCCGHSSLLQLCPVKVRVIQVSRVSLRRNACTLLPLCSVPRHPYPVPAVRCAPAAGTGWQGPRPLGRRAGTLTGRSHGRRESIAGPCSPPGT